MFVVSGSLSFIIVAASLLDLRGMGRARFITSVLITLAITTLLQAAIGHRLPLFEGPSTPYLAMLVVLVGMSPATPALRAQLASALIIAGLVVSAVSWFAATALARLVTPYVLGSFLSLLGVTLLLRLGPQAVGHSSTWPYQPMAVWALLAVLAASLAVHRFGPQLLRALIFLVAYAVGLSVFLLAGGPMHFSADVAPALIIPAVGPLAPPTPALVFLVTITMLIPLVNVYASIGAVVAAILPRPSVEVRMSALLYGASQVFAGLLGGMGTVPRSESSGLVAATGSATRRPLAIAAVALIIVAVLGPAVTVLAAFPVAVATDVLLVAVVFVEIIALRLYGQVPWRAPRAIATAAALVLCLAMTLVSANWGVAGAFLTNPILPGTVLAIGIDQAGRVKKGRSRSQRA